MVFLSIRKPGHFSYGLLFMGEKKEFLMGYFPKLLKEYLRLNSILNKKIPRD